MPYLQRKPFYLHRFSGELMAHTGVVGAGFYWVTMYDPNSFGDL